MLKELSRREKEANITPDPDLDVFMKVRSQGHTFGSNFCFFLYMSLTFMIKIVKTEVPL